MDYYYFYKITNTINGKYYYGVHHTNNLNDGYMGSGVALKRAYNKYGIENFTKEILHFFSSKEEMYDYEEKFVNEDFVNDYNCYNMVVGGRSVKTLTALSTIASKALTREEKIQRSKEGIYRYWHTGDVEMKKRKQSKASQKYWTTGDVEFKKKLHSEKMKKIRIEHPEIAENTRTVMHEYYYGVDGEKHRKQMGESLRKSEKFQSQMQRRRDKKENAGYNNFDFLNRWKSIYEKDMELVCRLLKYSNLPDQFIIKTLFNKPVKPYRLFAYYQYLGKLPEKLEEIEFTGFFRLDNFNGKGHKSTNNKKTVFTKELKYDFMLVYEDFFEQFSTVIKFMEDDSLSDSMIYNLDEYSRYVPNFHQVIEYFEELGVITEKQVIRIRVPKTVLEKHFTIPADKTKFSVDFKALNKILIDKEMNEYGIDDNGKPFCKGRFELEVDGKKCSI